jgi:GAF domain-containing protein
MIGHRHSLCLALRGDPGVARGRTNEAAAFPRQICYSHPNTNVMKPPIPLNEHARLELLRQYDVLDTAAEPAFDEITARAAEICQTPISLLTFVDRDRAWFKSNTGLDLREVPRDRSFCAHAICQDEPYVIPDLLADERFSHNPLVNQKPHLRSYAGMPLISPEGLALGTLCVIDRKPRELTAEQMDQLKELAKGAVLLLEIRRAGGRPPRA